MSNFELFQTMLDEADVKLNGDRAWDIQIHDEAVFERVLKHGSLGFGEAYMDGMWDCQQIDVMLDKVIRAKIDQKVSGMTKLKLGAAKVKSFFNPQSISRAKEDVSYHYDTGNDLFEAMLDENMAYTCGYWHDANNLHDAQNKKLDLICRKLDLKPGQRLLDIGCGWGSFMQYAAKHYGAICDGLTLSVEQAKLGAERCQDLPVRFILEDYREFTPEKKYDHIVSVGMLEHVGPDNYDNYFKCAEKFLADDGTFLLHTIGGNISNTVNDCDPWIRKYIFPNGVIPSICQLGKATEQRFNLEDLHNFGPDYDKTLMAWHERFEAAWPTLAEKYGEKFHRMWRYYLLSCAAAFRARDLNLWQLALTKIGHAHLDAVRAY